MHAHMMRNTHKVLVGNSSGKGQLGRPKHRWEDTIKIYLIEI
jgi:hypothetical protein